jgi:hypothetical protein
MILKGFSSLSSRQQVSVKRTIAFKGWKKALKEPARMPKLVSHKVVGSLKKNRPSAD